MADEVRRDYVRVVNGPQPHRHAYYAADEFLQHDGRAGTLTTVHGQRVGRVSAEFVAALIEELPPATQYLIGAQWGAADLGAFVPRVEREYEIDFARLGMGTMLETWWSSFAAGGWGRFRYDFGQAKRGIIVVELGDSAAAHAVGRSERPACHLYAGLFAACFSRMAERELAGVEIACVATGAERCRFIVSTVAKVDVVAARLNAGATADEILQELAGGGL